MSIDLVEEVPTRVTTYNGDIDYRIMLATAHATHARRAAKDTTTTSSMWLYRAGHRIAEVNLPPLPDGDMRYTMMGLPLLLVPLVEADEIVWLADVWVAAQNSVDEAIAAGTGLRPRDDPARSEALNMTIITKRGMQVFSETHDYVRREDGTLAFLAPRPQDSPFTSPPDVVGVRAIDPDNPEPVAPLPDWLAELPDTHPLRVAPILFNVVLADNDDTFSLFENKFGMAAFLSSLRCEVQFYDAPTLTEMTQ